MFPVSLVNQTGQSASRVGGRAPPVRNFVSDLFDENNRGTAGRSADERSFLDHASDVSEDMDIAQGIALDRAEVAVSTGGQRADLAVEAQRLRRLAGGRLDRLHRRHAVAHYRRATA